MPAVWLEALHRDGFCVIDAEHRGELEHIVDTLGPVVRRTRAELREGAGTYLTSPGPIAPHTDDPCARWIAWICHVQDATDGACLLVDGHAALRELDHDQLVELTRTELHYAAAAHGEPVAACPVLAGLGARRRIFYAPWLIPVPAAPALRALGQALDMEARYHLIEVRLRPGAALIVDNTRILHGRRALPERSDRHLERLWIGARPTAGP